MPKKIKFESFIYRFLMEAQRSASMENHQVTDGFINNLNFHYENKQIYISLKSNPANKISYDLSEPIFYFRGDTPKAQTLQLEKDLINKSDIIKHENAKKFSMMLVDACQKLGVK